LFKKEISFFSLCISIYNKDTLKMSEEGDYFEEDEGEYMGYEDIDEDIDVVEEDVEEDIDTIDDIIFIIQKLLKKRKPQISELKVALEIAKSHLDSKNVKKVDDVISDLRKFKGDVVPRDKRGEISEKMKNILNALTRLSKKSPSKRKDIGKRSSDVFVKEKHTDIITVAKSLKDAVSERRPRSSKVSKLLIDAQSYVDDEWKRRINKILKKFKSEKRVPKHLIPDIERVVRLLFTLSTTIKEKSEVRPADAIVSSLSEELASERKNVDTVIEYLEEAVILLKGANKTNAIRVLDKIRRNKRVTETDTIYIYKILDHMQKTASKAETEYEKSLEYMREQRGQEIDEFRPLKLIFPTLTLAELYNKQHPFYPLSYTTKPLKIVQKFAKAEAKRYRPLEYKQQVRDIDYWLDQNISNPLRTTVKKYLGNYFKVLLVKDSEGFIGESDKEDWGEKFDELMASLEPPKKIEWSEFYNERLQASYWKHIYERSLKKIQENPVIMKEIRDEIKKSEKSVGKVWKDISKRYTFGAKYDVDNMTLLELRNALHTKPSIVKPVDVKILTYLERLGLQDLEEKVFKNEELRLEIRNIIQKHIDDLPSSKTKERIQEKVKERARERAESIPMSDRYMRRFQRKREKEVKKEYEAILKKYQKEMKRYERRYRPETPEEASKRIEEEVNIFEENCFNASDGKVGDYLFKATFPLIFLDSQLLPFTKFFQAKIEDGGLPISMFPVPSHVTCGLLFYFPEMTMNYNSLSKREQKIVRDGLEGLSILKIKEIIERRTNQIIEYIDIVKPDWGKYAMAVPDKCLLDTQTGEDIPLEDIVIYYNPKKKVYSCHNVVDIFFTMSEGERPRNSVTGKKFSKKFTEKLKYSYPKLWNEISEGGTIEDILELAALYDRPRNPITKKEYSPQYIERLKKNYSKTWADISAASKHIYNLARYDDPVNPDTGKPYPPGYLTTSKERYPKLWDKTIYKIYGF
jgi:hypothetical protein